ncbi:MAG TPA: DUF3887 domain-containing protein [Pyrinomonadaceae bacterium]
MFHTFTLTIVTLVAALIIGHSGDGARQSSALIELAVDVVKQLAVEDFCAAQKNFDSNLKRILTTEKLQADWATLIAQFGAFKKQSQATPQKTPEGYDVVLITCEFEKSPVLIRVVFDGTQKIVGLWSIPGGEGTKPPSVNADLPQANPAEASKAGAKRVLDLLVAENFSEVWTLFNSQMKSGLSEQRLREGWNSLTASVGSFKRVVESNYTRMDDFNVVVMRCEFEKSYVQIRLAFDGEEKIAGLYLLPSQ